MKSSEWAGVFLALVAWGCVPGGQGGDDGAGGGGGDAGPGDPGSPPVSAIDEVARKWGRYRCEYALRCLGLNASDQLDSHFVEAGGDCAGWFTRRSLRFEETRLEADEFRFDAALFDRCAEQALDACWPITNVPGCSQVIRATRVRNEPCYLIHHCEPGLGCQQVVGSAEAEPDECPFRCRVAQAAGEPCFYDTECREADGRTATCRGEDLSAGEQGTCIQYRLETHVERGQACGLTGDAPDDLTWRHCAPGLFCDVAPGTDERRCRRPFALSGACSSSALTSPPCEDGHCVRGRCVGVTVRNAAGEDCSSDGSPYCNPAAGLVCVGGTCVPSDGSEGAPCDARLDPFPCEPGLYCAQGMCARKLPDGAECDDDVPADACQNICEPVADSERFECAPPRYAEICAR